MADYSRKNYLEEQIKKLKNQLDYLNEELELEKRKIAEENGNYVPSWATRASELGYYDEDNNFHFYDESDRETDRRLEAYMEESGPLENPRYF